MGVLGVFGDRDDSTRTNVGECRLNGQIRGTGFWSRGDIGDCLSERDPAFGHADHFSGPRGCHGENQRLRIGISHIFGGGGHSLAAGCEQEGNLEEVRSRILAAIQQVLP